MNSKLSPLVIFFILLASKLIGQPEIVFEDDQVDDRHIAIYCENREPGTYSVRIEFQLTNMVSSLPSGSTFVVAPNSRSLITTLRSNGGQWKYGFSTDYILGDINAVHEDDHIYLLPYMSGETHRIMQGYDGRFSHQGSNALDWDLEPGTSVLSARAGTVVDLRSGSNQGCAHPRCIDQANFIQIEHNDGTIADYAHLQKEGVQVRKGQKVAAGELIGFSGNTGWSSGPHLHLKVFVSTFDRRPVGVRTQFQTSDGVEFLTDGKMYRH